MIIKEENPKSAKEIRERGNTLWVEKYRPQKLDDVCIPKRIRNQIQYFIDNGITRHILLYGDTGTGKTTIMKILAKGHQTKFINASKERGIDTVKNVIAPFASVGSLSSKPKIVQLDEVDNLTGDAGLAFRGVIESNIKNVRYIATCNYFSSIEKAVKSRFGCKINFDFNGAESKEVAIQKVERIMMICKNEGLKIDKNAIVKIVMKYNDMRDIIETLQTLYETGVHDIKVEDVIATMDLDYNEFYKIVTTKGNIMNIRRYILDNFPNQYYKLIIMMGDNMIEWMSKNNIQPKILHIVYVLSNKYKNESMEKPDQLTSVMALCSEIQHLLK